MCGGSVDRSLQHNITVKAVCGYLNQCLTAYARPEQDVTEAGEAAARADIRLSDGRCVEVKTVDTRQRAHQGKLFPATADAIAAKVDRKYGSIACAKLIVTHAGALCPASFKTIAQLQRLHDDSWPRLDAGPSLLACVGAAAAKAEWLSYSAWHERLHVRNTAAALLDSVYPRPPGGVVPTGTQQSPRDAGLAQIALDVGAAAAWGGVGGSGARPRWRRVGGDWRW